MGQAAAHKAIQANSASRQFIDSPHTFISIDSSIDLAKPNPTKNTGNTHQQG